MVGEGRYMLDVPFMWLRKMQPNEILVNQSTCIVMVSHSWLPYNGKTASLGHFCVITAGCKELYGFFLYQKTLWGNTSDSSVSLCFYKTPQNCLICSLLKYYQSSLLIFQSNLSIEIVVIWMYRHKCCLYCPWAFNICLVAGLWRKHKICLRSDVRKIKWEFWENVLDMRIWFTTSLNFALHILGGKFCF